MEHSIESRLVVLNKIFNVYDEFSQPLEKICDKGCATCCTRNVTLTTLEGINILRNFTDGEQQKIVGSIKSEIEKKRIIPKITINEMAELCINGGSLPEEESEAFWGQCPLLSDNKCTIYDVRPFSCRCMMSKSRCSDSGFADMDDYTVTLNNVFMQYIEHIDIGGYFGNLSDILMYVDNEAEGSLNNFIKNHGVKMLMVPPEHQERIKDVIKALYGRQLRAY